MNNNNGHLSASERRLRDMAIHLARLEASQTEFHLLLNHLIKRNGGVYVIKKSDLVEDGLPLIVRSEIALDGSTITYTLCEPPPEPASRILSPG